MIGIHIPITLPDTDVDIIAATTPVETIQLHSTPRMNNVSIPAAPCSAYPTVRLCPISPSLRPTSLGSTENP
jgi:hypothetical protein